MFRPVYNVRDAAPLVLQPADTTHRQRQRQRLETSAATDYREMAGRGLSLPALRTGAEYDDIHQMKRSWDSWQTSTSL